MRTRDTTARRLALAGTSALGGVLLLASAGPAAAGTVQFTACPYLITAAGTYVLAADLHCNSPSPFPMPQTAAITVRADNVRLVLKGHTITGSGFGFGFSGIGVFGSPSHFLTGVSIEGGTITGFPSSGINVTSASGLRLSGVTATGNDTGVLMQACPGCEVVNSVASDNRGGDGIAFGVNTPNARISNDTATGNGVNGITLYAGSGSGSRMTGNVASGNNLNNAGASDLQDDNPSTAQGCANTWRHNTFGTAGGAGAGCIR